MIVNDNRIDAHPDLKLNPTYEQAQQFFGFRHVQSRGWNSTDIDESCWKMIGIEINTGIVVFRPKVLGQDGKPLGHIVIFRHYDGAQNFDHKVNPEYYTTGTGGMSGASGDKHGVVEFDMGRSHVIVDGVGPDSIWVSASPNNEPPQHSDMLENLGWHGATNHDAVSPIFQWVVKENGFIPPTPTGDYMLADIDSDGKIIKYIPFIEGQPDSQNILAIMIGDEIVAYQNWRTND